MSNPLPEWAHTVRPHQQDAVDAIMAEFEEHDVVLLDAPTGSGKTLIAELVRREMDVKGLYVCSTRSLQDQVLADFDYAQVLKGRANYGSQTEGVTADNCTWAPGEPCWYCSEREQCPYVIQKAATLGADLAVLNTAYLLAETTSPDQSAFYRQRPLVIADECDMLEGELMSVAKVEVSRWMIKQLGLTVPKKGMRYGEVAQWMSRICAPRMQQYATRVANSGSVDAQARAKRLRSQAGHLKWVATQIIGDGWVRDDHSEGLAFKPVKVDRYAKQRLWPVADKWLAMSATVINPAQMAEDDLGLDDWGFVSVPSTFDPENRRINVVGVEDMKAGDGWDEKARNMGRAISRVAEMHPGERVLVHTVSYKLASVITEVCSGLQRPVLTYTNARDRDAVIEEYRDTPGAVLVAPSLERGVDFKHDDCRCVIVAKVPFPYLGDRQTSTRMHGPGGQQWYLTQTVRSLVQMTGRGVRTPDDWAVNYILDAGIRRLLRQNRALFPDWWLEAVNPKFPRQLIVPNQ